MRQLSPVVWSEGMHLAPHHFQLQSRYFEESIQFALTSLYFKPYGVAGCELDAEALKNGIVSLIHARGVMPDGLAFHLPGGDSLPPPRQIGDLFSPVQEFHLVHLAISPYRSGSPNYVPSVNPGDFAARFSPETRPMADETTGIDERPVVIARRNFGLALDIELPDDIISLPIARIRRDGTGHFIYDPVFIPPCLQVGSSERLMQLLQRIIEVLEAKSDALASEGVSRQGSGEYASRGVAAFWLLHTVRASLAPLHYHLQVRRSHPEQVYLELVRLAGALCTFALESDPRSLPLYDHDQPEHCFEALDRHIRSHLELALPTSCVRIALRRSPTMQYFYTGAVTDRRCFSRALWLLGVRSSLSQAELAARVPARVKVCASRWVPELVKRASPGLALEHRPVPPPGIAPRAGTQYFSIATLGVCWGELLQTGEIGIYVPDSIPDAELELVVLLPPDQER
jgi:type VI secretion system protein ImpJ